MSYGWCRHKPLLLDASAAPYSTAMGIKCKDGVVLVSAGSAVSRLLVFHEGKGRPQRQRTHPPPVAFCRLLRS